MGWRSFEREGGRREEGFEVAFFFALVSLITSAWSE